MGLFSKKKLEQIQARKKEVKKYTILIVDDEASNRKTLYSLFEKKYNVLEAGDGQEALELMQGLDDPSKVSLVICDQRMPRLTGTEFFEKLIPIVPKTKRIILTGYMDVDAILDSVNKAQIYQFVVKPYDRDELLLIVERALEAFELQNELEEYNRTLERKVEERSMQLEQKNKEILRRQNQLITQRRMASLGTLTAGVAQEIKNPLNFINNFALLSEELSKDLKSLFEQQKENFSAEVAEQFTEIFQDLEQNSNLIYQNGAKVNQIVQSMMNFAGENVREWQSVELNSLIGKFTSIASNAVLVRYEDIKVKIETQLDDAVGQVEVMSQGLSRAIVNLVENALEAVIARAQTGEANYEPMVLVSTSRLEDKVAIKIRDNGVGIEDADRERIFEPFFSTKSHDDGNIGLGLVICNEIVVQEHSGELSVNSEKGNFSEFVITLPA